MPRTTKKELTWKIGIQNVRFKIQKDRSRAIAKMDVTRYSNEGRPNQDYEINIAVGSVWVDPYYNTAIKAYFLANTRSNQDRIFLKDLVSIGKCSYSDYSAGFSGIFTTESISSGIVRYGVAPKDEPYSNTMYEAGGDYSIYSSKEKAFQDLLKQASIIKSASGIESINLSLLPKSILSEAGFEEVPDQLKRNPSMYLGNINKFLYPGYGFQQRGKQREKVESIYKMIERSMEK